MTKGASGPTIVISIDSYLANSISAGMSSELIFTFDIFFSKAHPALPGATKTCVTSEKLAHCQAIACSLPPDPMIKTFINVSLFFSKKK